MAIAINFSTNNFDNEFLRSLATSMVNSQTDGSFNEDNRVVRAGDGFLADHKISVLSRTAAEKAENNAIRTAFCRGVEIELGRLGLDTSDLGKVFKAEDYGDGRPLTERRIVSVLNALSEIKKQRLAQAAAAETFTVNHLTSTTSADRIRHPEFAAELGKLAKDVIKEGYFESLAEKLAKKSKFNEIAPVISAFTSRVVMGARSINNKFDQDELNKIICAITRAAIEASGDLGLVIKGYGAEKMRVLGNELSDFSMEAAERFGTETLPELKRNAFKDRVITQEDIPTTMREDLGEDYDQYSPDELVGLIAEEATQNDRLTLRLLPTVVGAMQELMF